MFTRTFAVARLAAGIGLVALLPVGSALAGTCLTGTTCTFDLTFTNVTGVTINAEVVVNNTTDPLHTQLTVNYLSSNVINTPLGIDQFTYGTALGILPNGTANNNDPVTTNPPGGFKLDPCSLNAAGCQQDGFGAFDVGISDAGGTLLQFSFLLAGVETNFDSTSGDGGEFAFHIRFANGCSAQVGDFQVAQTPNTACSTTQQAPEPGTLALLGIAIAGIGYARSRIARS
jgi:hypothetical protein